MDCLQKIIAGDAHGCETSFCVPGVVASAGTVPNAFYENSDCILRSVIIHCRPRSSGFVAHVKECKL
jgi:hypothetical protein